LRTLLGEALWLPPSGCQLARSASRFGHQLLSGFFYLCGAASAVRRNYPKE
jgi:hypothetical protein